ncbi:MAG: hypothetical protein AAB625_02120 [Patescibacteria group bacterium]
MNDTTKQTVMDIAMNLHRIGGWVADDFKKNEKKIYIFIKNTDEYITTIQNLGDKFKPTWSNFINVYPNFKNDPRNNAENLMTWGNILTHRSKFL